ncbi:MAG: carbohydrate ABC transporter permease [Eubacteriales bacterium]
MTNAQTTLQKAAPKKQKTRKVASLDKKKSRAGWFFIAPFLIGFVLIYLPVIFNSIQSSFFSIRQGKLNQFIGLENYSYALFTDTSFVTTLWTGLKQLVIDIPAIVIFSLFMAVLLNQKMIGRAAFRAILFVPVILSTGLIAQIEADNTTLSNSMQSGVNTGAENSGNTQSATEIISAADVAILFEGMKVGTGLVQYIVQLVNDVYNIINRSGVQLLIFLAGLQSISPAIYESCSIDGATSWETFWKITFPMISPMILVNTIYTIIDSFTSTTTSPVMSYILNEYTTGGAQGTVHATAMGWIYFVIVLAIIGAVSGILSMYIFYQRRD